MTAKRQATLPKKLCEEMDLKPGDALIVDARVVDGEKVWVMKPAAEIETPWFSSLRPYAKAKRHDMRSIRKSIEKTRSRGEL
jgi:bifunctional DNA-binding transcriptional regulator/antitoxin component of YhaV-PrlF toxin-antitoxin module